MSKKSIHFRIWAVSAVLGICLSVNAFAEARPTELLVRYKNPSKSLIEKDYSGILNPREGLVKLKYSSAQEAQTARESLIRSGDVESVSSDFAYRLALHLQVKEVAAENTFLGMPVSLMDLLSGGASIPDVQQPGAVTVGADPLAAKDWSLSAIHMPSVDAVSSLQSGQQSIVAAVIDTGVDYNHEDLIGAMWRDPSKSQRVGYDFAHNNDKPYDVRHFDIDGCIKDKNCIKGVNEMQFLTNPGHGTHCAGHVGAVANNSLGIRGVGGNVQVMALKMFYDYTDGENAGQGDDAAAIQSIDYAIAHGVKVISASWGGRMARSDADQSELKAALLRAQQAGILFVVAAGNDGINNDTDDQPDFPATYHLDNMIVVAASDSNDALASFSSYGAATVDIAAPGVKIFSTTVGSTYNDVVASFTIHGKSGEMDWDGTSMATPIVAGAVALVWSKYPNENYQQIRQRILSAARPAAGLDGKVATGGVLDVSAALGL